MSRGYEIQWQERLTIHPGIVPGKARIAIELLPILPPQEMGVLLRSELEQRGARREHTKLVLDEGPVRITLSDEENQAEVEVPPADPSLPDRVFEVLEQKGWQRSGNGKLQLERESVTATLNRQQKLTLRGAGSRNPSLRQTLANEVRDAIDAQQPNVEARARELLREAIERVYEKALEKRAASLGTIESAERRETPDGGYELVLKVRVAS